MSTTHLVKRKRTEDDEGKTSQKSFNAQIVDFLMPSDTSELLSIKRGTKPPAKTSAFSKYFRDFSMTPKQIKNTFLKHSEALPYIHLHFANIAASILKQNSLSSMEEAEGNDRVYATVTAMAHCLKIAADAVGISKLSGEELNTDFKGLYDVTVNRMQEQEQKYRTQTANMEKHFNEGLKQMQKQSQEELKKKDENIKQLKDEIERLRRADCEVLEQKLEQKQEELEEANNKVKQYALYRMENECLKLERDANSNARVALLEQMDEFKKQTQEEADRSIETLRETIKESTARNKTAIEELQKELKQTKTELDSTKKMKTSNSTSNDKKDKLYVLSKFEDFIKDMRKHIQTGHFNAKTVASVSMPPPPPRQVTDLDVANRNIQAMKQRVQGMQLQQQVQGNQEQQHSAVGVGLDYDLLSGGLSFLGKLKSGGTVNTREQTLSYEHEAENEEYNADPDYYRPTEASDRVYKEMEEISKNGFNPDMF